MVDATDWRWLGEPTETIIAVDLGAAAIILVNVATLVLATTTPSAISPSTIPPSCA